MKRVALTAVTVSLVVAGSAVAGVFSNGPNLLESRCAVCHPSSKVKVLKRSAGQWDAIVSGMMQRGAKLSGEEKKTLVDYLAKTYKP
jgi:cytochrome c5